MTSRLFALAVTAAVAVGMAPRAEAAGCIRGALAGGIAGHYAGHTVLGTVGGCIVGRKLAKNREARAREEQALERQRRPVPYDGTSAPDPVYKHGPYASASRYGAPAPQPNAAQPNATGEPLYTGGAYRR